MSLLRKMEKISERLNRVAFVISNIFLWIMSIIVMTQIVTRYLFGYSISWAEEISKMLMVWGALLVAAVIEYEDRHLRVSFLLFRLNDKVHVIVKMVFQVIIAGFALLLLITGIIYTMDNANVLLPASGLTRFWLYLPMPICGALIFFHSITLFIKGIYQYKGEVPITKHTWEEEVH